VQWNRHAVFQKSARTEAEAEMLNRLRRESPAQEIRMLRIQSLEIETERRIHDDRQFVFRLRFLRLPCGGFLRLFRRVPKLRAKALLQFEGNTAQCRAVFRIGFFHEGSEVQDIAFCAAAEALENSFFQAGRERRRVFLAVVIRQRTETVMLFALAFDLDSVVPKHLLEIQFRAEGFEINPC